MQNIFELMSESSFDLQSLKRYIFMSGELMLTRTSAFALAKEWRTDLDLVFVRVLKVDDCYFVITNEEDYKLYWEARKIAMRNERKKKNETL